MKLLLGIVFDVIGFTSYVIPGIAELTDIIWAPASAYLMTKLYKGNKGKIAAIVSFLEEVMPWLDIIPTFTLMWFFTYVFNSDKKKETIKIIEV
ncbi:hypothetical protein [Tenacibaculum sp. SZ-18]|uniref:hypothetical protein n=1 Tax=Tenacibaculum sp. SZ-18 TaxID=754423 RepID=UPI001E2C58AA|nr:hypothetical protein [Tenacibaculum sp. SZ-18]